MTDADRVLSLLHSLNARATGLWRLEGLELIQAAFIAAPDMPRDVANGFAEGTRRVPLDRPELGIVRAVLERGVAVSRVEELPSSIGSGYWLKAFGAVRSVAVALKDGAGEVMGVFSVALPSNDVPDQEVARVVQQIAEGWTVGSP